MLGKLLGSPKVWGPLFAVVVLAFFYFLVNFGAAVDPVGNTRGLPVAIVSRDAGAKVGGEKQRLGKRVAAEATSNKKIGDSVSWTRLATRREALAGIADGKYDGALVIPEGYSQNVARISAAAAGGSTGRQPGPAGVEVLINPSAGPFSSATVEQILTGVVRGASKATSDQLVGALGSKNVKVSPAAAAVLGEPVVAKVTDAQPIGQRGGRGLLPFYLMFTASVLGFIGANAIHGVVGGLAETLATRANRVPSAVQTFAVRSVLGLILAVVVGAVEASVAFGIYDAYHEASAFHVFLFLSLVSLFAALAVLAAFGPGIGVLVGSFLVISLGLATSGGTTPVESLPGYLRSLSGVLPFEHATEGVRALLFYGGRLDAGLGDALWILAVYLIGAGVLGAGISLGRQRLGDRKNGKPLEEPVRAARAAANDTP